MPRPSADHRVQARRRQRHPPGPVRPELIPDRGDARGKVPPDEDTRPQSDHRRTEKSSRPAAGSRRISGSRSAPSPTSAASASSTSPTHKSRTRLTSPNSTLSPGSSSSPAAAHSLGRFACWPALTWRAPVLVERDCSGEASGELAHEIRLACERVRTSRQASGIVGEVRLSEHEWFLGDDVNVDL
jgi:flagellar hook-length control protein FliK